MQSLIIFAFIHSTKEEVNKEELEVRRNASALLTF